MDPDNGEPIYTLSGEAGIGATLPAMHAIFFTRMNGRTLRIHAPMRGATRYALPGTLKLTVGAAGHAMAKNIKALGMDGAVPQAVFFCDKLQLRLYQGAPLPKEG